MNNAIITQIVNTIYTMTEMWEINDNDGSITGNEVDKYAQTIRVCCEVLIAMMKRGDL